MEGSEGRVSSEANEGPVEEVDWGACAAVSTVMNWNKTGLCTSVFKGVVSVPRPRAVGVTSRSLALSDHLMMRLGQTVYKQCTGVVVSITRGMNGG